MKEFLIDGEKFFDFETFVSYMNSKAFTEYSWNGNLDAFADLIRGGFLNPIEGTKIIWINQNKAQSSLGYSETIKWLEKKLVQCHSSNVESVKQEIEAAKIQQGNTLFKIIAGIITDET